MARLRKQKTEDLPSIEVEPVTGQPGAFTMPPRDDDNVIPFTGGNRTLTNDRDTTELDQFLAGYGIQIV